jgi:acyl-CoA thioesterase
VQRVLAAADSANRVSAVLDWDRWSFANVDLTVHLARPPRGEWVCVDAATQVAADGVALATSTLYDTDGQIGTGVQSLLILPR